MRRRASAAPIAACIFLLAPAAPAQDARSLFQQGIERYERGDFRGALERFEEGYSIEPEPAFLYNIGRCHEQLGELDLAVEAYERYLSASPDGTDAADVQARIRSLQQRIRRERGETETETETEVREAPPAPRPRGRHQIGGGLAILWWLPANNPFTMRFEAEYRFEVAHGWRLVGDVSYVRIGESGDNLSEDGFGLAAGLQREWALGPPESAALFPHLRAQLVFESTSTRHETSSKHIAGRASAGSDWRLMPHGSLDLDLEIAMGLLSVDGGSGDSALFEVTVGGALRFLFDLG